jgi:hypothetical protein
MILEEMIDDPDVFFALQERGAHGGKNGRSDTGVGDRAVAEKTRVCGLDKLRPCIQHVIDALRAGGWKDDGQLEAFVGPDAHSEAPGRDFSLKGALAEARIRAAAAEPNSEAAIAAFHDSNIPEEAVTFVVEGERHQGGKRWVVAVVQYLSDGTAANGPTELAAELRAAGIGVTEV